MVQPSTIDYMCAQSSLREGKQQGQALGRDRLGGPAKGGETSVIPMQPTVLVREMQSPPVRIAE